MKLAFKVYLAVLEQAVDYLDRLFETAHLVVKWKPVGVILELVVPGPHTQDQPPTADLLDSGSHLGEKGRISPAHSQHQCP